MDRKESANGLQLIKFGAIKLRGHFSSLFMGTFAMCTPLILVLAIPMLLALLLENVWVFTIGVLLFILLAGPIQIGYIKFFNGTINGEQPRIRSIFSHFKFSVNTLKYIYFVGILFILYVLGFVLWIVPAGFAIAFFSMVLFFQEKFEYTRFSSAFKDCSRKMLGNRLAMFAYKLIFYFVYFLLLCMAGVSLCLIYTLSLESILVAYIVTVCLMIIFVFLFTMITLYYHSCNQIFFEDVLMFHERKEEEKRQEQEAKAKKKAEKAAKEAEENEKIAADAKAKLVAVTKKEEEKNKPAKAPAKKATTTKKTTTTKATTKKSTAATKKTTTTAKKTAPKATTKEVQEEK